MQLKNLLKPALMLACFGSLTVNAQQYVKAQQGQVLQGPPHRTCGTIAPDQQWEANFQQKVAEFLQSQGADLNNAKGNGSGNSTQAVYTIPVIIHVIHGGQAVGTFPNLAQGQLNSQIQVLNDDFAGVGLNVGNYPATAFTNYATAAGLAAANKDGSGRVKISNTGITFCLALKDSLGNVLAEPGIHRVNYTTLPAPTGTMTSKDPANAIYNNPTKFQAFIDGYIKPNTTWNCSKYMNLWVTDEQSAVGLLGYATFPPMSGNTGIPGGVGTRTTDGFWAWAGCFGSSTLFPGGSYAPPYDKGRTCTHEIGHWVGLRHIWGDAGQCGATDYCVDTPPQKGTTGPPAGCYYGTPTYPSNANTCTRPDGIASANVTNVNGDMFMNFMDYTDDIAMYMFTEDQRTRIQTTMLNSPYRKLLGTHGLCSVPPPVANFSISSTALCTGQTATITDMSTGSPGAWSYTMTGGTPATSTLQIPTVSYATAGTYTITLIASNGGGSSAAVSKTVTVTATPVLTVVPSPTTICAGSSATITSSGATTYTLNTGQTGASIVVSPTTTTTYTMTGANGSCTSTKTLQVVVSGSLSVNVTPTVSTICAGGTVTLTASGATTYTWNTSATGSTLAVTPTTTTVYTVTGTTGSCNGVKTATVNVNPLPTITITANPVSICPGNSSTLTASASAPGPWTYTWTGGSTGSTLTTSVPAVYTATVQNSNGCKSTQSFTLGSSAVPTLTATASPTAICAGGAATLSATGAVTYTWNPGGTGAAIGVTPTITTTYTVTGTNAGGCTGTKTITLVVNANPNVTVTPTAISICAGSTTTLTASGATTYTWNTGPNTAVISVTPALTTTYTVTGSNAAGCSGSKSATVTVNPLPTVTITANPVSICPGNSSTLTASASAPGPWTYTWTGGSNGSTLTTSVPAVYTATVQNANGCKSTQSFTLGSSAVPTLTATASPTAICAGGAATLSATGAVTYTWNPGGTGAAIGVTPTITTTYTVTGTNAGGCTGTKTITLVVNANPNVTVTPTAISICAGSTTTLTASGAATYTWNTGPNTAAITVTPSGTTVYTVTGSNAAGCKGSKSATVTINPLPTVTVTSNPVSICPGGSATLTAGASAPGPWTYTWTGGSNGSTLTTSVPAVYTATVQNSNGCTGTGSYTLGSSPSLSLTASATPSTLCTGGTASLSVTGAATYSWSTGSTGSVTTVSPTSPTTYTVTGLSGSCTGTTSIMVNVNSAPTVTAVTSSSLLCVGQTVTLTAGGATTYSWSTGASGANTTDSPTVTTTYTVTGTTAGCSGTTTVTQPVSLCTNVEQIEAPTYSFGVFPNPNNGEFTVTLGALTDNTYLDIYNNLGQLITHYRLSALNTHFNMLWEASGIYQVRISQDGQLMYHTKLIKSK